MSFETNLGVVSPRRYFASNLCLASVRDRAVGDESDPAIYSEIRRECGERFRSTQSGGTIT